MKFEIERDPHPLERPGGGPPPVRQLEVDADLDWIEFLSRVRDECLPAGHEALWIVLSLGDEPTLLALLPRKPIPPMPAPNIGGQLASFYAGARSARLHLVHAGDRDPQAVYEQLAGLVTGTL